MNQSPFFIDNGAVNLRIAKILQQFKPGGIYTYIQNEGRYR